MRLRLFVLTVSLAAAAQEDHSQHQHALTGLGTVNLATSCNSAAQNSISRAAALLHSFGYEESRLTFMQADKTYEWQKKGARILNELLPRHRDHPGIAHYIIHSVDYASTAELGLPAARAYAKIAPESSHALHMPSHIFTRLGLWDDSITSNIEAANSAVAQARRLRGGGGAFDQLHALDYLVYAFLQQAQDRSAGKALAEMAAITQLDEN